MGLILGLFAALLVGAAMTELGFTDPDFSLGSRIFSIFCGIIMMLPGIAMLPKLISDRRKSRKTAGKTGIKALFQFLQFQKKEPVTDENTPRENGIRAFTESYRRFFMKEGTEPNEALQSDATQLYFHLLTLQKRRLEEKGLRMEYSSRRMRYGDFPVYSEHTVSDGKYDITDVTETVEAKKVFYREDRFIGSDKCTEIATYTLPDPKTSGKGNVCCPNCGSYSTRENLLDGCDYCGTKFTVEDLEERVSGFSFRRNYELAYAKYQDARSRFSLWVGIITGIPVAIFGLVEAVAAVLGGAAEGSGPLMTICASLLSVAFVTFAAVFFSLCFFYFGLFPIIQTVAWSLRSLGKNLEALKQAQKTDPETEAQIRKEDPLFSLAGFYANLDNKLAAVLFGTTDDERTAFSEGEDADRDIISIKESVEDVINFTPQWMRIVSFEKDNEMSRMTVEGLLTLTKEQNGRIQKENRPVKIQLSRAADCPTKAVCGPSFVKCEGCGNAMSLLSGKKCEYCGHVRKMTSLDWAITGLQGLK